MHALVVYESMYGNTHLIADAIAIGLRGHGESRVVSVPEATADLVAWADLVVVGGPTHGHGMANERSRASARENAAKQQPAGWDLAMTLDPAAQGPGVREWLTALGPAEGKLGAAFDTRVGAPALITGRASSGISKLLREHGFDLADEPRSFIVDTHNRLKAGEQDKATRWGQELAAQLVPAGV